jgi:Fe2+ transport system protein FeoA
LWIDGDLRYVLGYDVEPRFAGPPIDAPGARPRCDGIRMAAPGTACVSLAELAPGRRARICAHPPRGPVPVRLEELGFVPGTRVEILRRAPLGDPIEIEIRGYRVCLRREDLASLCAVPEATER